MRARREKSRTTISKTRSSTSSCLTLSPAWRKLWRTMQASMFSTQIQRGLNFRKAFADAGFYLSGTCIWKKQSLVLGRSPYQWQHEPCLFGWKKNGKHQWYSDRKQTTIWEFDKPKKERRPPDNEADSAYCLPHKEFKHEQLYRPRPVRRLGQYAYRL